MMSQNLLSSNQSDVPFYMTTDTFKMKIPGLFQPKPKLSEIAPVVGNAVEISTDGAIAIYLTCLSKVAR